MAEDEAMSDVEEEIQESESPPKKSKKAAAGGTKEALAQLVKQKKAAAKAEDFAEALRLKQEIEALQAKAKAEKEAPKATASPKAKAGTKRPLSPAKEEPKPPAIEELATDPFFGDGSPALLAPTCDTAAEREAWRAVYHGNADFLREKLVGKLPLFCQRDIVSKQTALHLAIEKGDTKVISALAKHVHDMSGSTRMASMASQGTGTMNVLTLGFETGKIGAARGGRELNNALVDPKESPEPMHDVIGRASLSSEQLNLLMSLNFITQNAYMRRGKIRRIGRAGHQFSCDLMQCLEPAMKFGNLTVVREALKRLSSMGVGPAHNAACGATDMPEKLQARSVTAALRFGGALTSAHIAAINPEVARLSQLLKLEPTACAMKAENGSQPVHFAAACTHPEPLKLLLSEWSVDRRATGADKRTPLHFAAAAGRAECIKVIMGGEGIGPARSLAFAKEIRVVLLRQKSNIKIGTDGICILSRLLVDLLHRIVEDARKRAEQTPSLGLKALHQATKAVLKGALSGKIAETSGKLAGGKLGLPGLASELARSLSQAGGGELEQMFKAVDKNGDGKLDKGEIEAVFVSAKMRMNKKQIAKIARDMDTDGNGDVSLEEFSSWMEAGSNHALALRRYLVVDSGAMGQADVAEAEAAEEQELLLNVDQLAFDAQQLLRLLQFPNAADAEQFKQYSAYSSAVLECACTKVLEVSANAARSQKKTSVTPEHILNSIRANEDLQGLYNAESVVMNSLLLQAKDKDGCTALHLAAQAGHLACVQTLVACGADVDLLGPERKSALALASERGHLACVKELLQGGAKLELPDARKRTPLLLAVRSGQTVVASVLLNRGASANAADDSGNTVVHYAAAFGWLHCIEMLHSAGATLSCANAMKLAPITAALQKGHKTVFRRMLELGIDVNFRDADGTTLLLGCLGTVNRLVHKEIEFMMSKGADPALASSTGTTALHAVASARVPQESTAYVAHPFEAERLSRVTGWAERPKPKEEEQEEDEDEDEDEDEEPEPPAKKAKKGPEEGPMDPLVHRRGFHQLTETEREAVFRLGWMRDSWQKGSNPTKCWAALTEEERQAARTLGLEESTWAAVPVRIVAGMRTMDGGFPIQAGMAIGASEDGMVQVEVPGVGSTTKHISQVLLPEEDVEQVWGQTPHVTVAIARLLLDRGAPVDARSSTGTTPLMMALRNGYHDLALLLLERGADPNAQETEPPETAAAAGAPAAAPKPKKRPATPLDEAAVGAAGPSFGKSVHPPPQVIKELLAKGCQVQAPATEVDVSPVLKFLDMGHTISASLLIDAGADLSPDASGENALHKIFVQIFSDRLESKKTTRFLGLAKQLLGSAAWGAQLLGGCSRSHPRVTPLHSLVKAFASQSYRDPYQGTPRAGEEPDARAKVLVELLVAAPDAVDFSKSYRPPEEGQAKVQHPPSLLGLLCAQEQPTARSQELVVSAVSLLCRRGVTPNACNGSPAALHTLIKRLGPKLTASKLAKVLLTLTDLHALMPEGLTLLTFMLRGCRQEFSSQVPQARGAVRMLLEAKCDANLPDGPPKPALPQKPLHLAALVRDEGLVSDLLAARADPCGLDNAQSRRTPLHCAVASAPTGSDANFDIEECLVQARGDPAKQDALGFSVLHYALAKAENGALSFEGQWLAEVKQDPPAEEQRPQQPKKKQWTSQAWKLIQPRIDPIETISSLCVLPEVAVNAKDNSGMSPLHLAMLRGASICALKLISAGAALEETFEGNSPLGLAMHRYPDLAVLLMQKGADTLPKVVLFASPEDGGLCRGEPESIFSLAIRQISTSGAKKAGFLGAAIASMDSGFPREQALNDTIASEQFVMLLTLIPKVGDAVLRDLRFAGAQSLLHRLAASSFAQRSGGSPQQVQVLLRQALANGGSLQEVQDPFVRAASKLLERGVPVTVDEGGRTPLHLAALNRHADLVTLFLARGKVGPDLVRAVDADGRTALGCGLASFRASEDLRVAEELIAHGASARQAVVDPKHRTPALSHCISLRLPPASARAAESWVQVLFAKDHPDLTQLDADGRSCLVHAALSERFALSYLRLIMRWASAAGDGAAHALLSRVDAKGRTALMCAVDRGDVGFADALLAEADRVSRSALREVLEAKGPNGTTALIRAVDCPDAVGMVSVLLRWMDDTAAASALAAADSEGRTALMRAVLQNSAPVVLALLEGRPLQPAATKVSCPAGLMAGSPYMAQATYIGSAGGAPQYSMTWVTHQGTTSERIVLEADGWHSADTFSDASAPVPSGSLPNGAKVTFLRADPERVLVKHNREEHWVRARDVHVPGGPAACAQESRLAYFVRGAMPPGTGPGVQFELSWDGALGGPGHPGLAGGFAGGGGPGRAPAAALQAKDRQGCSALHLCVCPLPFGSYESSAILSALVKGGVPADLKDAGGQTAADLASKQRSGRMLRCLQELGVPSATGLVAGAGAAADAAAPWPAAVDVETDAARALAAADAEKHKGAAPEPPVEKHFQKPSAASDVIVALGPDGGPLDLVMTKVDMTRGPMPQNVFYRMQVLHERNQNNFFLFTRWGMIGERGQFQSTPFESLEKASAEFCKIFKSKAGNEWSARASFEKKPLKYQLHDLKYPTVTVKDALDMDSWKRLPTQLTPLSLRRLLNVGSSLQLLQHVLQQANIDQPLGALKKKPLDDAQALLQKVGELLQQNSEERSKSEPSGQKLQAILDEIAAASSRLYELVPTKNYDHARVGPIRNTRELKQWLLKLIQTDDIACAARILLGAQAQLASLSPTDYIHRALGIRAEALSSDSHELRFIEQYINRSAPGQCRLFSGEGAEPLPEKPKRKPGEEEPKVLPRWQALEDVVCYLDPACQKAQHAGRAVAAGSVVTEFEAKEGVICIRKRKTDQDPGLWVRPKGSEGSELMVKLTEREACSKVAAVYRVDRRGEEARAGGDSATLLFHGSGMANVLSILSQGLRVKPPGAQHSGSAFGNGVYFANSFVKSRGYCQLNDGVGYMLLCEVSPGKALTSQGFNFPQAVKNALVQAAKDRLGLPASTKPDDDPALKEAVQEIQQRLSSGEVEDVSGTGYDSFHMYSPSAPDPQGSVQHPDGYAVPCGKLVSRVGGGASADQARDEIIVYDTSRVRLRYVVELRDFTEHLKPIAKPGVEEENGQPADGASGGAGGGHGGSADEDEDMEDEDSGAEDEEEEDEEED